jgi:hypothetical protein
VSTVRIKDNSSKLRLELETLRDGVYSLARTPPLSLLESKRFPSQCKLPKDKETPRLTLLQFLTQRSVNTLMEALLLRATT